MKIKNASLFRNDIFNQLGKVLDIFGMRFLANLLCCFLIFLQAFVIHFFAFGILNRFRVFFCRFLQLIGIRIDFLRIVSPAIGIAVLLMVFFWNRYRLALFSDQSRIAAGSKKRFSPRIGEFFGEPRRLVDDFLRSFL